MPVGGAQPPNAVIGGIMATVLAISLKLEPAAAVGAAVPFALFRSIWRYFNLCFNVTNDGCG